MLINVGNSIKQQTFLIFFGIFIPPISGDFGDGLFLGLSHKTWNISEITFSWMTIKILQTFRIFMIYGLIFRTDVHCKDDMDQ